MPYAIALPLLSPTMETGVLAKWLVNVGDKVEPGDEIAEIETDKAVMVHEASETGIIVALLYENGQENIAVNTPIAVLTAEGEKSSPQEIQDFIHSIGSDKTAKKTDTLPVKKDSMQNLNSRKTNNQNQMRIFASPLARSIAKQAGIDLANIKGTGPRNRIVKADVENAKKIPQMKNVSDDKLPQNSYQTDSFEKKPLSNIRKIIARRITQAKTEIPHFYVTIECCADGLIETRKIINAAIDKNENVKISLNDFIIKAAAMALMKNPQVNSSFDNDDIIQHKNADVSVAVATKEGIMMPIVFQAQQKGLKNIAEIVQMLIDKAKNKRLMPNEYEGGSFAISNMGMYGVKQFSAIINPPQAAIIAVGVAEKRVVVNQQTEQIETKNMMTVSMSCDHRIIDGAVAADFLNDLKTYIEAPVQMLV